MSDGDLPPVPPPPRRAVRPNFAEDVYGTSSSVDSPASGELSESSLAQRRAAVLFKLKELKDVVSTTRAARQESLDTSFQNRPDTGDLDFTYTDCDSHIAELAELYTYSEMDDFVTNVQAYKNYTEEKQLPLTWSSLTRAQQKTVFLDQCSRIESAESDIRLNAARIILYLLQGAVLDFADDDDDDVNVKPVGERGTGGHEQECLKVGVLNAYLAYEAGLYQALATMLMVEIDEPFEGGAKDSTGGAMEPRPSSKASSVSNSRSASNIDLADHDRRGRRTATMADNESLRVVLSCLYHMVEALRRKELVDLAVSSHERKAVLLQLRADFLDELDSPLENIGMPLVMVLFEMTPQFYTLVSPHFPMKKVLLLIWKIILALLGGWDELRLKKEELRKKAGLPPIEDTLQVAARMKASTVTGNEGETGGAAIFRKRHLLQPGRMISRQMACQGNEDKMEEDLFDDNTEGEAKMNVDDATLRPGDTDGGNTPTVGTPLPSRRESEDRGGDRTPTAGSPTLLKPPLKSLPWKPKIRQDEIEAFIQVERQKFFQYQLPGDTSTLFALPPSICQGIAVLERHKYISLADIDIAREKDLNRYLFSMKENVEMNRTEKLYRQMLPNLSQYVVALLKVLLAAAPSSKARSDGINILCDVLTSEAEAHDVLSSSMHLDQSSGSALETSIRITIDVNRHKEILVKACSSILLLLLKHFRLNHVYQAEYLAQYVVFGNGIPLILKFLDQNMSKYIESKHEVHPFNYPQHILHYVRNKNEWPVLSADNVDDSAVVVDTSSGGLAVTPAYFLWRNVFSSINLLRLLNKMTKWKHARTMMLVVFKSAPILKRSLRVRLAVFQLYVLKMLKMLARYLGRPWRRTNMEILSSIYSKVRHRLNDDWAFANEAKTKSWDFNDEEAELKAAVERFHSRRYSHIYPAFAIDSSEAPLPGDDYLNRIDMKEFEPVDNCALSVLGFEPELSERFKKNWSKWVDEEVMKKKVDWDQILTASRGITSTEQI